MIPTEKELATLPKVAGTMPWSAYMLCGVEIAERASYYGCKQVFKNFIGLLFQRVETVLEPNHGEAKLPLVLLAREQLSLLP